ALLPAVLALPPPGVRRFVLSVTGGLSRGGECLRGSPIFFILQAVGDDRKKPRQAGGQRMLLLGGQRTVGQPVVHLLRGFVQAPDHLATTHLAAHRAALPSRGPTLLCTRRRLLIRPPRARRLVHVYAGSSRRLRGRGRLVQASWYGQ